MARAKNCSQLADIHASKLKQKQQQHQRQQQLQGFLRSPSPNDGQDGVSASKAAALRECLVRLLRTPADALTQWRAPLIEALGSMGAAAAAESAQRQLARAQKRRLDGGGAAAAASSKRARAGAPPDAGAAAAAAAVSEEQMVKLQELVTSLVTHGQAAAATTVFERLAPHVMAELVARLMTHLPPVLPGGFLHHPPPAGDGLGDGLSLGFVRGAPGAPLVLQPIPSSQQPWEQPAAAGGPPQQQQQQQHQQQPDEQPRATPPPASAAPPDPRRPAPLPIPLPPAALACLRQSAIRRILACPYHAAARTQQLLLARLAAKAAPEDGLGELLLERALDQWAAGAGQELALRWLFALFVACSGRRGGEGGDEEMGERQPEWMAMEVEQQRQQQQKEEEEEQEQEKEGDEEEDADAAAEASAAAAAAEVAAEGDQEVKAEPMEQDGDQPPETSDDAAAPPAAAAAAPRETAAAAAAAAAAVTITSSTGDINPDLSGTPYDDVLSALLEGLRERLPPSDRSIPALLLDAPAVPIGSTSAFLQDLLDQGEDWATAALVAARMLIEGRPPARRAMLELVLHSAAAGDAAVRNLGVKLAVNRLLERGDCEERIVEFAREQLRELEVRPEDAAAAAAAAAAAGGAAAAAAGGGGGGVEGGDRGSEGDAGAARSDDQTGGDEAAAMDEGVGEQQKGAAPPPPGVEPPPDAAADGGSEEEEPPPEGITEEEAARHCTLYLALCSKKPELLPLLFTSYGSWPEAAQLAVAAYARSLMRALSVGPPLPELVAAVTAPPEGAVPLLLVMLHALADLRTPQPRLVAAAVEHWKRSGGCLRGRLVLRLVGFLRGGGWLGLGC